MQNVLLDTYLARKRMLEAFVYDDKHKDIEISLVNLFMDYLVEALGVEPTEADIEQIRKRIIQSSRHLHIGVEQTDKFIEVSKLFSHFIADYNNRDSIDYIGSVYLEGFAKTYNGRINIELGYTGFGSFGFYLSCERHSAIYTGPGTISIQCYGRKNISSEERSYSELVLDANVQGHIPKSYELFNMLCNNLLSQELSFADSKWSLATFNEVEAGVLIWEVMQRCKGGYIDEYDWLEISESLTEEAKFGYFEFSDCGTFAELTELFCFFDDYYSNTYCDSLDGYSFGEHVLKNLIRNTIYSAETDEQLMEMVNAIHENCALFSDLEFDDAKDALKEFISEIFELEEELSEDEDEVPPYKKLPDLIDALEPDEEDDWY